MYSKGTLNTSAQELNYGNYNVDPLDMEEAQIYKK